MMDWMYRVRQKMAQMGGLCWASIYSYLRMLDYLHVFLFLLFSGLFVFAYIKIKYPFWNVQPVLHAYDFWRPWFNTSFVIYPYRPVKTKFCDFENVKTVAYVDCSPEQKRCALDLIQCYHLRCDDDRVVHNVTENVLDATMSGFSLLSFFMSDEIHIAGGELVARKCTGVIASRPVQMFVLNNKRTAYEKTPLYFFDCLAVNRNKKDVIRINRKLLQTHEYNQRIQAPRVLCSLLKTENDPFLGVVPLTTFNTFYYRLENIDFPRLPAHTHIQRIHKTNMELLMDFIHTLTQTDAAFFDACIFADVGTLVALIEANLLCVYCLRRGSDVYGYYFFKEANREYETEHETKNENVGNNSIHLIGCFMNTANDRFFYLGFVHCLYQLLRSAKERRIRVLMMDTTGHNGYILKHWNAIYRPLEERRNAYYLYNLVLPGSPLSSNKMMVLI